MIKLINVFTLIFALTVIPINLFGQITLTIEIEGLINSTGQVVLDLSNLKGELIYGVTKNIENNKCTIVIYNLSSGKYTFRYFHDENKNMALDSSWIGIPKEGFGFANNAKGTFGPPSLKKTIFQLKGNTTLICIPTYY